MNHPERIFSFKTIEKEDELVEAMTEHKWPLCYSFHYGNLLYLSDGDAEDAPDYAVVTIDKTEGHHGVHGREVGRIKPKEAGAQDVREFIRKMAEGKYTGVEAVRVQAEPMWHHSCQHCRLEEDE